MKGRITLIDNLDSFSYNLVDELSQLGYELKVYRNTISAERLLRELDSYSGPQVVCLSPGPGYPSQAAFVHDRRMPKTVSDARYLFRFSSSG